VKTELENMMDSLDRYTPLYITIDLDVLNCDEFSAVSFPQPGKGLKMNEILNCIENIKKQGIEIVGLDICEYNPELDTKNYLAGRKVVDFIYKTLAIMTGGKNE
jgi:arginase